MRGVLFIIIIALLLSGYSASAHVADLDDCNPQMELTGSTGANDFAKTDNTDDATKAPCLDCHHCCVSHALQLNTAAVIMSAQPALLNPPHVPDYTGQYHFSLLRPPKSLV
jgi:hypothetical protein